MTNLTNLQVNEATQTNSGDQPHEGQTCIEIFTDGACLGNPGPGGWGIVTLRRNSLGAVIKAKETSGGMADTTNVKMEMTAACIAIESLGSITAEPVTIYCDLNLIANAMNGWLAKWKANGWRKSDRQPAENRDLWERLERAAAGRNVTWRWIKGHRGHKHNERADALAGEAANKAKTDLATGQ
jgi:ribonuclease HI